MRASWTCFKWGLIATVLAGLGTWLYIERRVDEEIRRHAEAWLSQRCPKLAISVASARLVEGEGIYLRGIELKLPAFSPAEPFGTAHPAVSGAPPNANPAAASADPASFAELASIEEIFLACDTSLPRLVQGDVSIDRFVVRRPHLKVTRKSDQSWSLAALFGESPCAQDSLIPGTIEEGVLEFADSTRQPEGRWTLREINLALTSGRDEHGPFLRVAGKFSGDHLRQAEIITLDHRPALQSTGLHLKVSGLEVSPQLLAALPREASPHAAALSSVKARANLDVRLAHLSGQTPSWRFDVTTEIKDGRIEHARLPLPLEQLRGVVKIDQEGVTVRELTATSRQTSLRLDGQRQGWEPAAPMRWILAARQIVLEPRMRDALPPEWRAIWNDFSPAGETDVDVNLTFDGRAWHPQATLTAHNLTMTYFEYPYPVQRCAGTLTMEGEHFQFDMVGSARGVPVKATGEIHGVGPPGRDVRGNVHIVAQKLRSDPDMIAALKPEPRKIVESFQAAGIFDLDLTLWWQPHDPVIHRTMKLAIHEAIGRYVAFPYALTNVSGLIEQVNDTEWRFTNMQALHGSGKITGFGTVKPWQSPQAPQFGVDDHLELHLRGENVSINDELRAALPPATQRLWETLKPQGAADLGVELHLLVKQDRTSLAVNISPRGDSVSIEPAAFPYRWEKIKGNVIYRDGNVTLSKLSAVHGDTTCRADNGRASITPRGDWELVLDDLAVERLRVDRDLVRSAPAAFRQLLLELRPTGAFNLYGERSRNDSRREDSPRSAFRLAQGAGPNDRLRADWNITVHCHGNTLQTAIPLENLFGSVLLAGQSLGGQAIIQGQLALDSVTCRGLQFTEVRGPILVEPNRILLGKPLEERFESGPQRISARCFDGTLYGDAWLRRPELPVAGTNRPNLNVPANMNNPTTAARFDPSNSPPWEFSLRANLEQADLGRFAREAAAGRQKITGRLDGALTLNGSSESSRDLKGVGTLRLRETNLYELPLFLSLLPVLSLKEPDLTAFTSGDVQFRISGDDGQVYFPNISLRGEALSLTGRGAMGFDRKLLLAFEPQLGNGKNRLPIIGQLLHDAQIAKVYVNGTLDQPRVHQEPFPGLKEVLEGLQPAPLLPQMGSTPGGLLPNTMRTPLAPLR